MASDKSAVRSIRLPKEIWAQLTDEAAKRETTVNELMHSFAIVGLLKSAEGRASANPEQICKAQRPKKIPAPKVEPNAPKLSLQVGPARVAPGSRLKKR